ncbi:MAG: NADH-quinone oxidoreductase subunit H [Clostridium sp.]|nr:NADH-quinone oxidoreductase subunit H [Clostridium sp.]
MMFLTVLVLPFLFIGLINKMKALYVGKQGASVFQPYFDFFKLIKKGEVLSDTSSFVFRIAPSVNLACTIIAAVLLTLFHFSGDFILFSYILAVGKFFSVIAAMDTGSSFEGMGASREVSYTSFVEPAFFIIIGSVAALNGHYSFVSIFGLLQSKNEIVMLIAVLAIFAIFMMILIEGSRVPIDDPKTHLELTMIHEVMVLDNSGVDLAFIHYASALKMLLFSALISFIICPQYFWAEILVILFIAFLIATIESIGARIRLTHIIEYTFTMIAVALIVMALVLLIMHGGRF